MKAKVPAKREHDGDGFRRRHQLRAVAEREVEGVRQAVVVNDAESPLGWLKSRKDRNGRPLISDDQCRGALARRLLVCPSQSARDRSAPAKSSSDRPNATCQALRPDSQRVAETGATRFAPLGKRGLSAYARCMAVGRAR